MSAPDNGGTVFPIFIVAGDADPQQVKDACRDAVGLTLRDYFAAKAMQAHVSAQWTQHYATKPNDDVNNFWEDIDIAMCAYDMADAMLEARKTA